MLWFERNDGKTRRGVRKEGRMLVYSVLNTNNNNNINIYNIAKKLT